jgi:hypothetical protein
MSGRYPLKQVVWAAGAAASLLLYAARALPLPRRTAVGVERRLFGGSEYRMLRNPATGRWLVSLGRPADPNAPPSALPPPTPWGGFAAALTSFTWPGTGVTGRTLAPFRSEGTWEMGPLGLRRVWRLSATNRSEKPRGPLLSITDPPAVLDLKSRRTYRGAAAQQRLSDWGETVDDWMSWTEYDDTDLEVGDYSHQEHRDVDGRRIFLLWNDPPVPGSGLYAASDHAAPRVLRLAGDATFAELSPDGRTLFFQRHGALWRLDLRRPLPDLLDEAAPPPLPEPPLSAME